MLFSVYIMSNFTHSVLYIGVTNNLIRRVAEHKSGNFSGFTQKYKTKKLVYYESGALGQLALAREKQLKGWTRAKKNALITSLSPDWKDLSLDWYE